MGEIVPVRHVLGMALSDHDEAPVKNEVGGLKASALFVHALAHRPEARSRRGWTFAPKTEQRAEQRGSWNQYAPAGMQSKWRRVDAG